MARTVNREAHELRRDEFVVAAQSLMATRGFERLSVKDILDEVGASKGAFYHYFGSKQDLLEAVTERIAADADAVVETIAADPSIPALEKLQRFFSVIVAWKTERKELLVALLRVWQSDDNALVRDKVMRTSEVRLRPRIAAIVRQGIEEGEFTLVHPDESAGLIVALIMDLGTTMGRQYVAFQEGRVQLDEIERTIIAHSRAFERILGAPPGSLTLVDEAAMHAWYQ